MIGVTCCVCGQKIALIPDGILRYCPCRGLGIDHTKEYTRYLGTIPVEHSGYVQYEEKHRHLLEHMMDLWKAKSILGGDMYPMNVKTNQVDSPKCVP